MSLNQKLYAQVFKLVLGGTHCHGYIQWINLTQRSTNHIWFYVLWYFLDFQEWQNSDSGSDNTKSLLTLHHWVGLMHNSINAKEPTSCPS